MTNTAIDESPQSRNLAGHLPRSVADLVRRCSSSPGRHGFRVLSGASSGHIFFDAGRVIHAEFGEDCGLRAVVEMLRVGSVLLEPAASWPAQASLHLGPELLLSLTERDASRVVRKIDLPVEPPPLPQPESIEPAARVETQLLPPASPVAPRRKASGVMPRPPVPPQSSITWSSLVAPVMTPPPAPVARAPLSEPPKLPAPPLVRAQKPRSRSIVVARPAPAGGERRPLHGGVPLAARMAEAAGVSRAAHAAGRARAASSPAPSASAAPGARRSDPAAAPGTPQGHRASPPSAAPASAQARRASPPSAAPASAQARRASQPSAAPAAARAPAGAATDAAAARAAASAAGRSAAGTAGQSAAAAAPASRPARASRPAAADAPAARARSTRPAGDSVRPGVASATGAAITRPSERPRAPRESIRPPASALVVAPTTMVRVAPRGEVLAARGKNAAQIAEAAAFIHGLANLIAQDFGRNGRANVHLYGQGQSLLVARSEVNDIAAACGASERVSSLLAKVGLK